MVVGILVVAVVGYYGVVNLVVGVTTFVSLAILVLYGCYS